MIKKADGVLDFFSLDGNQELVGGRVKPKPSRGILGTELPMVRIRIKDVQQIQKQHKDEKITRDIFREVNQTSDSKVLPTFLPVVVYSQMHLKV
ncbi:hypothetical protein KQX54_005236 [Cotesia glomerata]|uniref:Uncharacterized protein n=1 Tax=Cotesia glomerata TaxID=32391 RepID=A0AAV7J2Q0_COTGL|nr:hypothetical protein KQX54_005236 [Cotesia glomerata]